MESYLFPLPLSSFLYINIINKLKEQQETCTFGTLITIHTIENKKNLNIVTIKKRATWDGQHAQLYCNVSDIQTETYFNFIHNHHHHHALLAAFLHLLPTTTTYDRQP